jgi:CheY-like chemotaxis protein
MDEDGGVLEVSLGEENITTPTSFHDFHLPPGPYLKLSIRDTGKGIHPEIMGKIFEPYFTTKELGRGTGLGLSVIHGIVKSHQGAITCSSALNEGSTFDIFLPMIASKSSKSAYEIKKPLPGGSERILFVDDEMILADMAVRMLSSRGYTVVPKTGSLDALELFRKDPGGFDLVITDMTMPGMRGDRLTEELIAIRKDIPVILCSGYSEHISEARAKEIGIREFIMKPLDMRTLTETVRRVLDQSA